MKEKFDLIVIGSGPGGYVAAIKAAKLGMKTAIIENREVGGTCLNRGCIPTKTIMHSSHLYYEAKNYDKLGIQLTGLSYDIKKIQERKEEVILKIRTGITGLLEANGVTILKGTATIADSNTIIFKNNNSEQELLTEKILIATGSKPSIPEMEGIHLNHVVTSDDLLSKQDKLYKKLLIIGGGVIGIEFATIYQELGCEVEIIEAMDRILPTMDKEISQSVSMSLKKKGVKIHTKCKVIRIKEAEELYCEYMEGAIDTAGANIKTTTTDGILVSIGRKANTEGLFGKNFSLNMEYDKIKVDENFQTNIKGIYAIGDVIKGMQLAHVASAQGIVAVENMCNQIPSINLSVIPSCIYCSPEIATVGMNEDEAKAYGYTVKTGKYPMLGNSKTILSMEERGYIKVVCDLATDKILGAQLICARATDMIGEFATAIASGLTVKDMQAVIRPHPTYNEAVTEVFEDIDGMAIHLIPKKR